MGSDSTSLNLYDAGEQFTTIYPSYDLSLLPKWIIKNLDGARVIGKSKKTIILPNGMKYNLNNKLNHLSGSEWTYFINSVLNTKYVTFGKEGYAHKIRKIHPTPKPPQLMRDIISFFTKENELVFDYFMGVGGSLLGASLCGRTAAGIDLSEKYISAYQAAAKELNQPVFNTIVGDAFSVLSDTNAMNKLINEKKISLLLLDPPYSNMMSRVKTGADIEVYGNIATPFTNDNKDLGNLDYVGFLDALKKSVELALPYIKFRGHIIIFIKDLQPSKKNTNLLHSEVINKINEISIVYYKGMKIWADQTAKLFPYGYPFSFVANQIHQYILIFRKEK